MGPWEFSGLRQVWGRETHRCPRCWRYLILDSSSSGSPVLFSPSKWWFNSQHPPAPQKGQCSRMTGGIPCPGLKLAMLPAIRKASSSYHLDCQLHLSGGLTSICSEDFIYIPSFNRKPFLKSRLSQFSLLLFSYEPHSLCQRSSLRACHMLLVFFR